MVKNTTRSNKKSPVKKLSANSSVIILCCLTAILLIGFFARYSYEINRDRPLVNGFEYVGRNISPECVVIQWPLVCGTAAAYGGAHYYATDVAPDMIKGAFPGWEVEGESTDIPSDRNTKLIKLKSDESSEQIAIQYISDTPNATKNYKLSQTNKKYLVLISGEDYEQFEYLQSKR